MVRIGVISDSHHKSDIVKSAISYLKNLGVDLLLHAGDIVEASTLKDMEKSGIKYAAVLGNNDEHLKNLKDKFELFDEPHELNFNGIKIRLMHHPFYIPQNAPFDIVVYGHTHYFVAVKDSNMLFLNPGEICGRKKPKYEFCYIEIDNGKYKIFKVESSALNNAKPAWSQREVKL